MRRLTFRAAMTGAAALFLCGLALPAHGQAPLPDVVYITGTVRDFHRSHPDFGGMPMEGAGHCALNVELDLDDYSLPVFRGAGFKVWTQWRDKEFRNIPPHLYAGGAGLVKLAAAPTVDPGATVDTWDSAAGPYGGGNVGPAPTFYVGAEMPTIEEPAGMPPNVGIASYHGGGTITLDADLHCDVLSIRDLHKLRVVGDVTVLCEQQLIMRDGGTIELAPAATLTIYTKGDVEIVDSTANANTGEPGRFRLYHLGEGDLRLGDGAEFHAAIVAPETGLHLADDGQFYGTYTGKTLDVLNMAGFHLDARMPLNACGERLADTVGQPGVNSTGGITSAVTFAEWYRDIMGVNLSMPYTIALHRNPTGIYEFVSNAFYPLDGGRLFGNEGERHNYYFTFTFTAKFTYEACGDQFFEFMGADDAWLFVDDQLGIDLGGMIPVTQQHLALDRLGLDDGLTYTMHFFYAQRNPATAIFQLRTNVPLVTPELATVSAGFD